MLFSGNRTIKSVKRNTNGDFPGGPVVENPPSSIGDEDPILGGGTKIPHSMG